MSQGRPGSFKQHGHYNSNQNANTTIFPPEYPPQEFINNNWSNPGQFVPLMRPFHVNRDVLLPRHNLQRQNARNLPNRMGSLPIPDKLNLPQRQYYPGFNSGMMNNSINSHFPHDSKFSKVSNHTRQWQSHECFNNDNQKFLPGRNIGLAGNGFNRPNNIIMNSKTIPNNNPISDHVSYHGYGSVVDHNINTNSNRPPILYNTSQVKESTDSDINNCNQLANNRTQFESCRDVVNPIPSYQKDFLPPCNIAERGRERIHNDYNQHFVDTGERTQNFIRDAEKSERFAEYPKLDKLMQLKKEINMKRVTPAQHIKADLYTFDFKSLKSKFDVILIDPPWAEYQLRVAGGFCPSEDLTPWSLDSLKNLPIDVIGDTPSFCFVWAGATHLEDARVLLNHWGYRRREDICWLKTNKKATQRKNSNAASTVPSTAYYDERSLLQRTKEHCLMGIKGSVRRSLDTYFIHANLDTDVIVDEEPDELGSTAKPYELYDIIERFCLGRKRIELFGLDRNIRNGWLTIGQYISFTNFNANLYNSWFEGEIAWPEAQTYLGGRYVGSSQEIEQLRPKSPSRTSGSSGNANLRQEENSSTAVNIPNNQHSNKRHKISDD